MSVDRKRHSIVVPATPSFAIYQDMKVLDLSLGIKTAFGCCHLVF